MRITKALIEGQPRWIRVEGRTYHVLNCDTPMEALEAAEQVTVGPDGLTFVNPFWGRNVVGLAYNYKSLIGDQSRYDEPLMFMKSANSVCPHESRIAFPRGVEKVWVEVELVVVIGRECSRVSVEQAADYIYGYTVGSDMTADNIAGRDHHLARSKAIDNFGPVGPCIVTDVDTGDLELRTDINGKLFQKGRTSDRILNDAESVSLVSQFITLFPGDLIFTGTTAGAMDSLVKPGDSVSHRIAEIGELSFTIA